MTCQPLALGGAALALLVAARPSDAKPPSRAATGHPAPASSARRTSSTHAARRAPAPYHPPRGWANTVRGWHTPAPERACPTTPEGRPMLVLEALNGGERAALRPERDDGGFSASELERAARLLRDPRTGNEHPVDPRLLDLVYRIERKFDAQAIRVISGYRTPKPGTHSNHGKGRAMDIIVPGASDEDVASFARTMGFVGVGIYPVSGFVHVDTRTRSYFWIDRSGPRQRNRTAGILGGLAKEVDAKALARGERPPSPFAMPGSDLAAAEHAVAATQHDEADEDEGAPGVGDDSGG